MPSPFPPGHRTTNCKVLACDPDKDVSSPLNTKLFQNILIKRYFQDPKLLPIFRTQNYFRGWSGGAIVLGKLPVPGRPTIWIGVGQGPTALAVGAGGGCLDIFTLDYPFSPLSPSLWETARYRLKYCLKGPLNPKQPTKITSFIIKMTLTLRKIISIQE